MQQADVTASLGGTVAGIFQNAAAANPHGVALRSDTVSITYCALEAQVNQCAHALIAQGVMRGDRVAILSENSIPFVILMLACARIGAIATCLNWRATVADIGHCLAVSTPRVLYFSAPLTQLVPHDTPDIQRINLDTDFHNLLAAQPNTDPNITVASEDGLLILFTSGTTGKPKAALISHRAMIARWLLLCTDWHVQRGDGFIAWSPLSHMAGTDVTFACLMQGATVTVLPGFDPDAIIRALAQHPVCWLVLLPGMIERMADALERCNVPLHKVGLTGAMADLVPGEQIARISRLLQTTFVNSFGSTETGLPPATANGFAPGVVPTSLAKRQSSGCHIRLVDEDGQDVAQGQVGELWMRGPTLFSGYWANPQATAEAFADGWYHMGDAFWRDEQGLLHFADRKKYLIKSGGENIYPAEIERVLRGLAGVADACVVRRQDAVWGEVPVAFVVVAPDAAPSQADLQAAFTAQLARFKHPKAIYFVQEADIERNVTGKIRRDLLEHRAQAEAATA